MKTSSNNLGQFPEGTPVDSSDITPNTKLMTRRQFTAGTLAALTALVAFESAHEKKISEGISELTNKLRTMLGLRSKYDLSAGKNLKPIEKKNVPLSKDLSCTLTVYFTSPRKNAEGEDYHSPIIKVSIDDLPLNQDGTKNTINFILSLRTTTTPARGVENFLGTTITTDSQRDPNKEHIEYIHQKLGDMETENSVSDSANALKKFATSDLEPYLKIQQWADEEVADLARRTIELSLVEYEAKQLASALAGNSEELSE